MTQEKSLQVTPKFEELESIRGIAALIVVIHHIPHWNNQFFNIGIFRNGFLMVELFFVLSGFVIYRAYADQIKTGRDLLRFQFLRFGRLYPVHFLLLIAFLGLEFLKYFLASHYGINSPNSTPFVLNNASAFTAHLFLVQALGVLDYVGSFNSPSWSISTEFYTYLIFGFVILKLYRWRVSVFTMLLVGCYLLIQLPQLERFDYFLTCIVGFSTGCLISVLISYSSRPLPAFVPLIPITGLVIFLYKYPVGDMYPLIFILSAALIYTVVKSKDGFVKKALRVNIFKKLGEISYSVYMSHYIILWVINQFLRVVLKRPEAIIKGESFPQLNVTESFLAYTVAVVITLFVSSLMYKYIEEPFRKRSRSFAFKKMPK